MIRHTPLRQGGLPLVLLCGLIASLGMTGAALADNSSSVQASAQISALVQIQPLARKTLTPTIQTYGQVIADPTKTLSVTTQAGGQVTQLMVEAGQWVHKGQKLLELTLDPKARLDYQKAQTQLTVAEQDLRQTQYLFARQLATKQDVALARQAVSDARKTGQAQRKIGSNQTVHVIRASEDALVLHIPVSVGSLVPPGGALVSMSSRHTLLLRLGIEPEDARRVASGMAVKFVPVFNRASDHQSDRMARVVRVDGQINPTTRLLDVVARPDSSPQSGVKAGETSPGDLIAGMTVKARLDLPSRTGLVAPTDSVLDHGSDQTHVYLVKDGHAESVPIRTEITVGGMTMIEPVKPGTLHTGDSIVVVGQYSLQPGMAVRIQSSGKTTGATE
jgi:RND family efflux transporter MFP subunit